MAGIRDVARNAGVSAEAAKNIFAAIVTMLGENADMIVKIQGFGSFRLVTRSGRTQVSPIINGGAPMEVGEMLGIKFHSSNLSKHRVNMAAKRRSRADATNKRLMENPPKAKAKTARAATKFQKR